VQSARGGAAAWYHPKLYHRVLAYSITAINQQWPHVAETPHGAWQLHERLIPNGPAKPIRVSLAVGDRDVLKPNVTRNGMHAWVLASENMARVLAAKGYRYQYVFARNAGHVDRDVKLQAADASGRAGMVVGGSCRSAKELTLTHRSSLVSSSARQGERGRGTRQASQEAARESSEPALYVWRGGDQEGCQE
jgi:hypothetical protein